MWDTVTQILLKSFSRDDRLTEKYMKLIHDLRVEHEKRIGLKYTLEIYVYYRYIEEVYQEEYGFLTDYTYHLYSIMKTIHITNYNDDVINSVLPFLKSTLEFCDGKYYLKHDLTDKKVLKMLYEHIAEESMDEEIVKYYNILMDYDGYGNEYYIHDYQETWTSEDGGHCCRFWEPQHTIEDYVKVGLPEKIE